MARADEAGHDGAHIVAVHTPESGRKDFENAVFARHRLVWLDTRDMFNLYGTPEFTDQLLAPIVEFEKEWRASIRPSLACPLMLPGSTFKAVGKPAEIWRRAQHVRISFDSLDNVKGFVKLFRERYYKGDGVWVDEGGTEYTRDKSGHRIHTPAERRWKYTVDVSEGVHFDMIDRHTNKHENIDCHGHIL
ncbi:MAG: hypothetical protein WBD55_04510 [Dehalococcoidia bacterium]